MADEVTPPVVVDSPPPAAAAPPADAPPPAAAAAPPADAPPPAAATPPPDASRTRIEELAAQNKREREYMTEYAEFWRQQALKNAAPPAPAEPAAPAADAAPSLDSFDSTEKWAAAHAAWASREIDRRAAAAVDAQLNSREQQTAEQATRAGYLERLAALEKDTPNVRTTINNPVFSAQLARQPVMTDVIMASEHGPAVALHLSTNPIEADRISRLPPVQAAAAIGRIEATLAARAAAPKPPVTPPRTASQAPPPPSPISGNGSPTVDLTNCSLSEYVRIRGEQRRAREGGRR